MIRRRAERKAAAAQREVNTASAPVTQTPTSPPTSPLNDATNTSRLPFRPSTSSSSGPLVNPDGSQDDSEPEVAAERPPKKAKHHPPRRIEDSGNESDVDGEEVEEAGSVVAVQAKHKTRQGPQSSKGVGSRPKTRRSTGKSNKNSVA